VGNELLHIFKKLDAFKNILEFKSIECKYDKTFMITFNEWSQIKLIGFINFYEWVFTLVITFISIYLHNFYHDNIL